MKASHPPAPDDNDLGGSLPTEMGKLSRLEGLDLGKFDIYSTKFLFLLVQLESTI